MVVHNYVTQVSDRRKGFRVSIDFAHNRAEVRQLPPGSTDRTDPDAPYCHVMYSDSEDEADDWATDASSDDGKSQKDDPPDSGAAGPCDPLIIESFSEAFFGLNGLAVLFELSHQDAQPPDSDSDVDEPCDRWDYIFVGRAVTKFSLEHPIERLCAPVGHEGRPFPYAVDGNGSVIILDELCESGFTRMTNLPRDFAGYAELPDSDSDDGDGDSNGDGDDERSSSRSRSSDSVGYDDYEPPEDTKIYCLYDCARVIPNYWGVESRMVPSTVLTPAIVS